MKVTQKLASLALAACLGAFPFSPGIAQAEGDAIIEAVPTTVNATPSEVGQFDVRLLAAIREARTKLTNLVEAEKADPNRSQETVPNQASPVKVTIAVWDAASGEVVYVGATKQGRTVTPNSGSRFTFKVLSDNGVNTALALLNSPGSYVVGLVHPIFRSVGTKRKPKFELESVAYVPYTSELRNPYLVEVGSSYFEQKVANVFAEIRALGLRSRAEPSQLLADVVHPAVVKSIIAIEHVGSSKQLVGDLAAYLDRFYVTLATNEHRAYAYAKSTAAARGLVQFIPSTYRALTQLRPDLVVPLDFENGMLDPYSAIKATVALLDYNLSLLPKNLRERYRKDDRALGAYLAAAYNGGPSRVIRAHRAYGENWYRYQARRSSSLKRETVDYVAKYQLVFDHFSTPALHLAAED